MNKILLSLILSTFLFSLVSSEYYYIAGTTSDDAISSNYQLGVLVFINNSQSIILTTVGSLSNGVLTGSSGGLFIKDISGNLINSSSNYADNNYTTSTKLVGGRYYRIEIQNMYLLSAPLFRRAPANFTFYTSLPRKVNNELTIVNLSNNGADTLNTILYNPSYFSYNKLLPYNFTNISYTASTKESTPNNFILNLTYDSDIYSSATAILYYNNTAYASTKTDIGDVSTYTNTITSPGVSANTNISFYWTLQLYNGSDYKYINTSTYNQTVISFGFDDCSTYTFKIMNFTIYDEDTLTRLRTPTYNQTYQIELYLNDVLTYAKNRTSVNELVICSKVAITGNTSMDYIVRYDADGTSTGYVNEYYNVRNFDLNSFTTNRNISLYDLAATNSEECLFTIKDANFLPLNDGIVEITRRYLSDGTYKTVEIPATDSLGKTIGHFVLNDEVYSIYLRKDGNLLASYTNVKAVKPTGSDCIFNLNIPSASSTPEDFTAYGDLLYESFYEDSTRTYSIDWVTNSGSSSNLTLYAYINGVKVCSNQILASSGTSSCVFSSSYTNQSARLVLLNSGSVVFEDYVNIGYKRPNLNPIRYLVAAALIPIMVLMAGSSIIIATVFFIMGLILSGGLFLFDTQTMIGAGSFIMWLVIAGGILLIKFSRRASNG